MAVASSPEPSARPVAATFASRRVALAAVLAAAAALAPRAASAQTRYGVWLWSELRVPIVRRAPGFPRTSMRVFTDVRLDDVAGGVRQSFLRVGPLVDLTRWLFVGVHATVLAERLADGRFQQEVRAELEPNLYGRLGDFTYNDRNRLEFRWRDTGSRWRYRNQLRVNYAPVGARWIPFVWDEVLVDLSGEGVNQNRVMGGLAYMLNAYTRLEAGWLLRSEPRAGSWAHDRFGLVSLFVDLP